MNCVCSGIKIHSLKHTQKNNLPNRTNIRSNIGTGSCELFSILLTCNSLFCSATYIFLLQIQSQLLNWVRKNNLKNIISLIKEIIFLYCSLNQDYHIAKNHLSFWVFDCHLANLNFLYMKNFVRGKQCIFSFFRFAESTAKEDYRSIWRLVARKPHNKTFRTIQ